MNTQPNTVAITQFQPSENTGLARTLWSLEENMKAAARQNVMAAISAPGSNPEAFSDLQIEAMVQTEALRLVNGMDLATILLRGKILKDIEDRALFSVHPNQYRDLSHLAQEQGISVSELSDIRTMTWVIFPWIENTLQVPVAQIWETIGKAKFRMMCPVLKALITGEEPDTATARQNYERILDTAAIEMREAGEEPTEEAVRNRAARSLIDTAGQVPTRELQEHIRDGNPTPALNPVIVKVSGRAYMLSEINEEQMLVARRKLGRHMADPITVDLPEDARARQREAARVPLLRQLNRIFEG
jgi:hypothetical protein